MNVNLCFALGAPLIAATFLQPRSNQKLAPSKNPLREVPLMQSLQMSSLMVGVVVYMVLFGSPTL